MKNNTQGLVVALQNDKGFYDAARTYLPYSLTDSRNVANFTKLVTVAMPLIESHLENNELTTPEIVGCIIEAADDCKLGMGQAEVMRALFTQLGGV